MSLISSSSIGVQQASTSQEPYMVNTVALPFNAIAGNVSHLKHSMFFAKVVNKRAFGVET